jgi:hypothetical protein
MQAAFLFGQSSDEPGPPYSPFLLSVVPGISVPQGLYDVSFAAGWVGSGVNDVQGFQASGIFDLARDVNGFQGSGVFNIARGEVNGFQGSGVFNIARGEVNGFQGSGVFNVAHGKVDGFQGAGVFNVAAAVAGGQAAGVINVAGDVRGLQVGLINVADNIDGAQIGLINIARNGVQSLGFIYEPATDYAYAYWQAGTRALYTVVGVGAPGGDWFVTDQRLLVSLGLGSRISFCRAYLDFDVSAEQMIGPDPGTFFNKLFSCDARHDAGFLHPYPSIRLMLGLPLTHRVHLVGGLKVDVDLADSPQVPAALKVGSPYTATWFNVPFTAWPRWYIGIKI